MVHMHSFNKSEAFDALNIYFSFKLDVMGILMQHLSLDFLNIHAPRQ